VKGDKMLTLVASVLNSERRFVYAPKSAIATKRATLVEIDFATTVVKEPASFKSSTIS
jgi:hypothetical protein